MDFRKESHQRGGGRRKVVDRRAARNLLISPDNFFLSFNSEPVSFKEIRKAFRHQFTSTSDNRSSHYLRNLPRSPLRSPPRNFKKGALGWYDPLKRNDKIVEAIDGVQKRWTEEDNEAMLSRIFDSSSSLYAGDSGDTSSDDISEDSVEFTSQKCISHDLTHQQHQATALTILQKWLHMAKINLRIKKVVENRAMVCSESIMVLL
jgi:hypothetical protein